MLYHPVRRAFAFLAACAIVGVPAGLYISLFQYDAHGVLMLVAGGFMTVLLFTFGIFAAKSANGMPASALNILRALAVILGITLAGIVTVTVPGRPVANSTAAEQQAVKTKYTNRVDVNGCKPYDRTTREVEDLTISNVSDTCTVVLPLTRYSVVVVPDNVTATLRTMQVDMNKAVVKLVFPVDSLVHVFVYDRTDAAHAAVRPGWALTGGLPRTTIYSTHSI